MKKWNGFIVVCAAFFLAAFPRARGLDIPGRFYTGEDATGPDVLALWSFQAGAETEDSSGHGHTLSLRGEARFNPDGKFGSCLETHPVTPRSWHGGRVASHPALSPAGPFTIELWINPDPALADKVHAYLVDKMAWTTLHRKPDAECQRDYMMRLERERDGVHRVAVFLGFDREGSVSKYTSDPISFRPGEWVHIAFAYDGQGGGRIYIDGVLRGEERYSSRRSIVPGHRLLMIGTRGVSTRNSSFPGRIDQVRLLNRAASFLSETVEVRPSTVRRTFLRMEKEAAVKWAIRNARTVPLRGADLTLSFNGDRMSSISLPDLAPGGGCEIRCPIDSTLRSGAYVLQARLSASDRVIERDIPIRMVDRDRPRRMPVVAWDKHRPRWGSFNRVTDLLSGMGFTHRLSGAGINEGMVWQAGAPVPDAPAEEFRRLDHALARDMKIAFLPMTCRPSEPWPLSTLDDGRFARVDREGQPKQPFNACGLFEELPRFYYHLGVSLAEAYSRCPAWDSILPQSERRDGTSPCFHAHDRAAFRNYSGLDIPREVKDRYGVNYRSLPDFPEGRTIPDDHPILVYYRWFWGGGDGWPRLNTRINEGMHTSDRKDLWSWYDPAIRVPSAWGSGGKVDFLNQWTYTYPNPEVIGLNTDELFAMAAGQPGQGVMKMTQIIWYRSRTAPDVREDFQAEWEKGPHANPKRARWITISPDHLRIAFWSKLSRPIQGIMYHGFASLLPLDPENLLTSYRYTHPETKHAFKDLIERVVGPLGPTLLQVPDPAPEIAFLESFTSQIFTRGGLYGWGGELWPRSETSWGADSYLALRYAQLQPKIVYEEEILERGLDGIKILFMTECPVLTESLVETVRAFQQNGGIVVGDERLAPDLVPDMTFRRYERSPRGDESRAALLDTAARMRRDLDAFVTRFTDTDNPDVLTRLRRYGSTDYVFAYNDNRQFGTYVGHHGLVMEDGVPSSATVKVRRAGGHVYDLLEHRAVAASVSDGWLEIPRAFAAGEGRLWMVTARPIGAVRIRAPERVQRGERFAVEIAVTDPRGKRLDAVVPVRVEILDARGAPMEFSGHYGAKDGRVHIAYDSAANDAPGDWIVRATELASGMTEEITIRVE